MTIGKNMTLSFSKSEFQVSQRSADVIEVTIRGIKIRLWRQETGIMVDAYHPDAAVAGVNLTTQVETRFNAPYHTMFLPYQLDHNPQT
jgi:hypothetical protein